MDVMAFYNDPNCLRTTLVNLLTKRTVSLSNEERILKYYNDIDSGDIKSVLDLFSEGGTYKRGLALPLVGKAEIRDFYTKVRALEGQHEILRVEKLRANVSVDGVFKGTYDGKPIELKFKDYWKFGSDGKVVRRESILEIDGV